MSNKKTPPATNVNALLDFLISRLKLANDAALSRSLKVEPPVISKLRHNKLSLGPSLLIRIHDVADMTLDEIRKIAGIEFVRAKVAA